MSEIYLPAPDPTSALANLFSGYAADAAGTAAPANGGALPAPSTIRPTVPTTMQVDMPPASTVHPAFQPLPASPNAMPAVPQQQVHQDEIVGNDHWVDPKDKSLGISGIWDTNRAPKVNGVFSDVPSNSERIHG